MLFNRTLSSIRTMHRSWFRRSSRTFIAFLLVAALAPLLGPTKPVSAQSPCGDSVIVTVGDTLREIAARCDTSVGAIVDANPDIVNRNLIYVGQTIQIPQDDEQPAQPSVRLVPDAASPGAVIDVFATGFPANSDLTIGIGRGQLINSASVVTNAQGEAETNLTVPAAAPIGQDLEVTAYVPELNGPSASAALTVGATPGQNDGVDVSITPTSGPPGTSVSLDATGLPANATIDIGAGRAASEYDIIAQAQSDAQGNLERTVAIPELAESGEEWVIALTPADSPADYISNRFDVTEPAEDGSDDNLFTRTNIYLIALEDAGRSGMQVGCGDSVVPVEVQIEPTLAVLTAATRQLVNLDERFYGQSGLYNALYRSDLNVDEVTLQDGEAVIRLSGEVNLGGVCDAPRFRAQLRQTALQYYTVDSVSIFINGEPLDAVIQ